MTDSRVPPKINGPRIKFECIIELGENDDIQVSHLAEELEDYFRTYDNNTKIIWWRTNGT